MCRHVCTCALQASPPDVWQQLRDLCRRNIDCLEKLLEEQEALVKQQARQLQQQALLIQGERHCVSCGSA